MHARQLILIRFAAQTNTGRRMTKFIIVAGGVISGVGKGVAAASIGRILEEYGFSVTAIKIDPYINCDAGTMRPTEHGEVWVTDDGGETDQDLGNYERFLGVSIPKRNNITTGQVYKKVIDDERSGRYLGQTVQLIPHITDEIRDRIVEASSGFDIAIVEVGGTVGDYENIPFLFSIKNMENEIGKGNMCYMLVTYLPIPSHIDEMKTKPTQTSVKLLRENGIQPDFILCRGKNALDEPRKKKIEQYAQIVADHVISMPDVTGPGTVNSLYAIPLQLQGEGLGEKLLATLGLAKKRDATFTEWRGMMDGITAAAREVRVGMVGKYLDIGDYRLADSYISVNEALRHACAEHKARLRLEWINSKDLESDKFDARSLDQYDGIIVPGGFGSSGVEGKISAIRYCRENDKPFLGLCYGLQLSIVEFARNVCGLEGAHTTEIDPGAKNPVIDILPEQKGVIKKGGTMRLGAYPAVLKGGTVVHSLYGRDSVTERHRHRYEVNPEYHAVLQEHGMVFSGMSPDGRLVEFIELPGRRFFVATQAHPEFKSRFLSPAPLFDGFIGACLAADGAPARPGEAQAMARH